MVIDKAVNVSELARLLAGIAYSATLDNTVSMKVDRSSRRTSNLNGVVLSGSDVGSCMPNFVGFTMLLIILKRYRAGWK
jgi:hypothetical protein